MANSDEKVAVVIANEQETATVELLIDEAYLVVEVSSIDELEVVTETEIVEVKNYADEYRGAHHVIPRAYEAQVLETKDKKMMDNITVAEIPYFETSNSFGNTIYIGNEV